MRSIPKDRIAQEAKGMADSVACTALERKIFDLPVFKKEGERESPHPKSPYVVLKYFQSDWECFSHWQKDELSQFSNFLQTFAGHTWQSVYKTGGKGENKAGLGYTPYQIEDMKSGSEHLRKVRAKISEDIKFFELRVSQRMRVHGFQAQAAFFLVLLDREHRVFS